MNELTTKRRSVKRVGQKAGKKAYWLFFCREGVQGAWEGTASQIAISNLTPAFCRVGC